MGEENVVSGEVTSWTDGLPEDLRTEETLPTFQKFKPGEGENLVPMPVSIAKSYLEAQRAISKKTIGNPYDEKLPPEEKERIWKEIGVPENPDGYEFKKPDSLPEGMTYNEDRTKAFAQLFREIGLPKSIAKMIFDKYNEGQVAEWEEAGKAADKFLAESTATMKKEWGKDFDTNLEKSDSIIEPIFGKEFKQMLEETGLKNHPGMIRGLFKVTKKVSEKSLEAGVKPVTESAVKMDDIYKMKADPRYWDPSRRSADYVKEVDSAVERLVRAQQA